MRSELEIEDHFKRLIAFREKWLGIESERIKKQAEGKETEDE